MKPSPLLEPAILSAAVRGDREATGAVLTALLPRIRRMLARYAGVGPELDDLTQEVLMAVARGLPGFRGDAALSTWVYRICVRTAYQSRRRELHLVPLEDAPALAEAPAALDMLSLHRLAEAVDALPPDRRTLFVLHDVEGYTRSEVAALLDVPEGTVADRLHRARHQLRQALRAWRAS